MARFHSSWLTANYGKACQQPLVKISFAGSRLTVHRDTVAVWAAVAAVLNAFEYKVHPPYPEGDTGAYNCRQVTGGTSMSPHAWGVAADINWKTNPYIRTPDRRKINWQTDTDMSPAMIEQVRRITTANGQRAVWWGGDWVTIKDAMHFQVIATPAEIATGIVTPPLPGVPVPGATWKKPGDDVITTADATAALTYMSGAAYWQSLFDSADDEALIKTGQLADRAMVLREGIIVINTLTKAIHDRCIATMRPLIHLSTD